MKNKKKAYILVIFALSFFLLVYLALKSWTTTKYGRINTKVAVMLKMQKYLGSSLTKEKSITEMRESISKNYKRWSEKPIAFNNIKNFKITTSSTQIPIRLYTPENGEKLPIIIYSHGGIWIGGSIDDYDNICRKLSKKTNALVISVGYRLAPENPFPAGLNDIYNVLLWVHKNADSINGDSNMIAVAGDSSGGNLSAAVCQMARDKKGPAVKCQVLIYPATNIYKLNSSSWSYFGSDYLLTKETMEKCISMYTPKKEERKSPYASPLLAKNFNELPSMLMITAEFDPLRDEGETYAQKLKESGINVEVTRYKGVAHGFVSMDMISNKAENAINEIALYLQNNFHK